MQLELSQQQAAKARMHPTAAFAHPGAKLDAETTTRITRASKVMNAADEVVGPGFGLHLDPTDIFPEHSNADELNPADEKDGDHQGGIPLAVYTKKGSAKNDYRGIDEAKRRHQKADYCPNLEWQRREGEDSVHGIAEQFDQTPGGLSPATQDSLIWELDTSESSPGKPTFGKATGLSHRCDGLYGDSVEKNELVTGPFSKLNRTN